MDTTAVSLSIFLLMSSVATILASRRWQEKVASLALPRTPQRLLKLAFWAFCCTSGLLGLLLMRLWQTDSSAWESNSPRWLFFVLTALLIIDMITFGIVLTPLTVSKERPVRILRAVGLLECALVVPMALVVLFGLMTFIKHVGHP